MRHGDKINNLGRTASHRRALLSNLAAQLIQHKRITTTLAKAKALRTYVEPLITKAKDNTTHQRRVVFSYLQDKFAIQELFDVIRLKTEGRPGGYTRIIKLGIRKGDNAELALIELVDYNEVYGKGIGEQKETTKRTRRAGRRKPSSTDAVEGTTSPVADAAAIAPVESNENAEAGNVPPQVDDIDAGGVVETNNEETAPKEDKAPE